MFRLLRLAIYALVGYAAYQFVMDLVNGVQQQQQKGQGRQQGQGQSQARGNRGGGNRGRGRTTPTRGGTKAVAGAVMTAAARAGGQGKQEETQNPDGGTVRHRVGRGVV
jgi:hypothetical protein